MAKYATLAALLLRASADDIARAASRDQPTLVDGALLRRAAAEPQPLDQAALDRLAGESGETIYAAAQAAPNFVAADFAASSETGSVVPPAYVVPSYLAVAVPESLGVDAIWIGEFDQFSAFEPADPVEIDGVRCAVWRTTVRWSTRSSGQALRPAPLHGGKRLWNADAVASLPGTLARIEAALEDADAEIDSRLGPRYPAALPTRALESKACDLAAQQIVGGDGETAIGLRWTAAQRWLRDIAAGAADLDAPEPPVADQPAVAAPPSVFGGGALDPYLSWR